jgi:hypothetical protein
MNQQEVRGAAKALLMAGGVVAIVIGAIDLLGVGLRGGIGLAELRPIVAIAVGIIALATMSQTRGAVIELVLIVLGIFSGSAGGFLIAVGGLLGLVSIHAWPVEQTAAKPSTAST